jgi:hypothetical protein
MTRDADHLVPSGGELLLYQTEDGRTRVQCRFEDGTLWLTQAQMAELFQIGVGTVNHHLKAIYAEGELPPEATIRPYRIVRVEGSRQIARNIEHYNLAAILAVGFRVRSHRGTQFRQWAIERLDEYLVKGFTMDDERLKNPPGPGHVDYFDELLARIRDIRSSEKVFYKKVLEIYATSIDYDPRAEASQRFFKTVQNKMHWAVHGQTAAEVIAARADASKPNMGLTSFTGPAPRRADVAIAKDYLSADELEVLNRIVNAYLELAELQALRRKPMYTADWIAKLDDFLRLSERDILDHAGKVSHEAAMAKAELEYERFAAQRAALPSPVEAHFEEAVQETRQLETRRPARNDAKRRAKPERSKQR